MTIIDSVQADVKRDKHRERVISSRLVLLWKETDTGYKAKARCCMHGFKDPDTREIERSCPKPDLSSINITLQILASTTSEGTLADGEKALMQGDPSFREEPLYAGAGQRHVRAAITNRLPVERGRLRYKYIYIYMYIYKPCGNSGRRRHDRTWRVCWLCVTRGGRPFDGWHPKGTS